MILVQRILTLWTKATRGAPRAQERAQLPRALSLIATDAADSLQHYGMSEGDGFLSCLHGSELRRCRPIGARGFSELPTRQ